MAGIALGALTTVGPVVIQKLIPLAVQGVVKLVDKLFGNKTGPLKMSASQAVLKTLLDAFAAKLDPSVGLPGEGEQKDLIQQTVDLLNQAGELKGHDTVIFPSEVGSTTDQMDGLALVLEGTLKLLRLRGIKG